MANPLRTTQWVLAPPFPSLTSRSTADWKEGRTSGSHCHLKMPTWQGHCISRSSVPCDSLSPPASRLFQLHDLVPHDQHLGLGHHTAVECSIPLFMLFPGCRRPIQRTTLLRVCCYTVLSILGRYLSHPIKCQR